MSNKIPSLVVIFVSSVVESYVLVALSPYVASQWQLRTINLWVLTFNTLLFIIYKLVLYPTFLTPFRSLPSPGAGNFVFGHGDIRTEQEKGERPRKWIDSIPNDGLIYVRDLFGTDALLPTTPELLKAILADNTYDYEKDPTIQNILRKLLGDGLILVEGGAHKFQRKRKPAFITIIQHRITDSRGRSPSQLSGQNYS